MSTPGACRRLLIACLLGAAAAATAETPRMILTTNGGGGTVQLGAGEAVHYTLPLLAGRLPDETGVTDAGGAWCRVRMAWELRAGVQQDELAVRF